ncbi:MAG TPA: TetR/AcrR family transcriptional regulator [Candidatus Limnocylindrales bacterium]|nr:TetR/AcrR family transcriptional regulator [Candidatus Limnocylindrales bacterium]
MTKATHKGRSGSGAPPGEGQSSGRGRRAVPSSAVARDRETTKQETREALVAAGLAEFAERGLDAPSLDAICARAGFTRGAFYVHFHDRDEFLECVMERVFGAFLDAVIATGDNAHDLEQTVSRFADAASMVGRRHARPLALSIDLHRVLDACARSPVLKKRFVTMFSGGAERVAAAARRGQQAGSVRSDVDAATLGSLLTILALGVVTSLDMGVPTDFQGLRDTVLRLLAESAGM